MKRQVSAVYCYLKKVYICLLINLDHRYCLFKLKDGQDDGPFSMYSFYTRKHLIVFPVIERDEG